MSRRSLHEEGGPAFPVEGMPGMSLRDYFAAQCSAGAVEHISNMLVIDDVVACSVHDTDEEIDARAEAVATERAIGDAELMARAAYIYADALLRARKEEGR